MASGISLTEVREAAGNNLKCLEAILAILAKSDQPARTLKCKPGDPNCPDPRMDRTCLGFKRPDMPVIDALEIILHNFEFYLELFKRFEEPRIPLPEDWEPLDKPAGSKAEG